jgi:hypothetical protein
MPSHLQIVDSLLEIEPKEFTAKILNTKISSSGMSSTDMEWFSTSVVVFSVGPIYNTLQAESCILICCNDVLRFS